MKTFLKFAPIAAMGLLAACGAETEVAETEAPLATETLGTETEMATPVAGPTWDMNSDGRFEQAEYSAYGPANYGLYDTNSDNRIDATEFNTGWTNAGWRDGERAFGQFDANSDGFLDNNEFFGSDRYATFDANSDGALEGEEWAY